MSRGQRFCRCTHGSLWLNRVVGVWTLRVATPPSDGRSAALASRHGRPGQQTDAVHGDHALSSDRLPTHVGRLGAVIPGRRSRGRQPKGWRASGHGDPPAAVCGLGEGVSVNHRAVAILSQIRLCGRSLTIAQLLRLAYRSLDRYSAPSRALVQPSCSIIGPLPGVRG